jgi:hypothetical protein
MRLIFIPIIVLHLFAVSFSQSSSQASSAIRKAELKSISYRDSVRTMHDYWGNDEWVREDNIRGFQVKYVFGDLAGDRDEEAAVSVSYNFGGSGSFTGVFVYRYLGGPQLIGTVKGGDRAHGGIKTVRIENRQLIVETFAQNPDDCMACYGSVLTTKYEWIDGKLVNVGGDMRSLQPPAKK